MKIDELLDKYFEGETSNEEEKLIRRYFSEEKIPENLLCYKPMFAYFDKEIDKEKQIHKVVPRKRTIMYTISSITACTLIAIAVNTFIHHNKVENGNYVMIDGKTYTDEAVVKAYAKASFNDVATSQDEVFSELFND